MFASFFVDICEGSAKQPRMDLHSRYPAISDLKARARKRIPHRRAPAAAACAAVNTITEYFKIHSWLRPPGADEETK